jgi:hypothetical protein
MHLKRLWELSCQLPENERDIDENKMMQILYELYNEGSMIVKESNRQEDADERDLLIELCGETAILSLSKAISHLCTGLNPTICQRLIMIPLQIAIGKLVYALYPELPEFVLWLKKTGQWEQALKTCGKNNRF